jgi:hypothetical protein
MNQAKTNTKMKTLMARATPPNIIFGRSVLEFVNLTFSKAKAFNFLFAFFLLYCGKNSNAYSSKDC